MKKYFNGVIYNKLISIFQFKVYLRLVIAK